MDFSGKHVFITGGSRGIGRAVATAFAARGARVAVNYISNTDAAEMTLASLEGGPHMMVQGDVSDPESVRNMIETGKGHDDRFVSHRCSDPVACSDAAGHAF